MDLEGNLIKDNGGAGIQGCGVDRLTVMNNTIPGHGSAVDFSHGGNLLWSGNAVFGNNGNDSQPSSSGTFDGNARPTVSIGPIDGLVGAFAVVGEPVNFNFSFSDDGTVGAVLWDLGDGLPQIDASPSHVYLNPGTYKVGLVVWDNGGRGDYEEVTLTVVPQPASVVGRHVLYNNSAFDAGAAGDDGAIAPDKVALLPGQTAAFVNYTSYSRGLNGIVVDIAGLHDPAELTADDFAFRVGNNDETGGWSAAPAPLSISVRPGEGAGGADRVTIVWSDNAIQKQWLEVTIESTEDTGLAAADVFYFGNAIGETGNSTANAIVSSADEALARLNLRGPFNPAPLDFLYDFNRDRLVNSADQALARLGVTNAFSALRLISPPALAASASAAAVPEPATWVLGSLGMVAFGVVARRARPRR
jgi:PKD repeat protein